MITFLQTDLFLQSILLLLMYLLNLSQYVYLILLFHSGERRLMFRSIMSALLIFILITLLSSSMHLGEGTAGSLPAAAVWIGWLFLAGDTAAGICRQVRVLKQRLSPQSIKEAADRLSSGLVYFSRDGLIVLCNTRMQELFYRKTGHDLQLLQELENVLQDSLLYLPDGSVWKMDQSEVSIGGHDHYIQYLAADVTQLYQIRETIARDNEKMQQMIRQVQHITENIADITRQEEILAAKMRVHTQMGSCMTAVRQYLLSETPHTAADKQQLLQLWEDNLKELQNEIGAGDAPDAYEMVVQIARSLGLEVILHGMMPEDSQSAGLLLSALRECVTNAINHAGAKRLNMTVTTSDTHISALYTNDGMVPQGKMREGGGLSSLRIKVENAGGEMEVSHQPVFALTVVVPLAEYRTMGNLMSV